MRGVAGRERGLGSGPSTNPTPSPISDSDSVSEHRRPRSPKRKLAPEHARTLALELDPQDQVVTGDIVHVTIRADALQGDDVTVPEQSFAPFEVQSKRARVEPAKDGRQQFVFDIELLAFDPGDSRSRRSSCAS